VIDVNVSLHQWPFRRLAGDDPASLAAALRGKGVTQAWAGSFEGLLHRDLGGVNARLAADCARHGGGLFLPFGEINPKLPDWQEELRRCHEIHHMRGIRLHPNYHGYALDDPACAELLAAAARRGLIVQIALVMEDERTQYPLLRVPPVNPAPLAAMVKGLPKLRLMVLNSNRPPVAKQLSAAGLVYFDVAMVESVGGVTKLAGEVSAARVVFGSHSPFFYFESAALKVKEAGLAEADSRAVMESNAAELLRSRNAA
jgi:predicted TIM-barrel fold metal-dependent hydrolase